MLRALIRKKLLEFRANKGPLGLVISLAAISLFPLLRLSFDSPVATFVPLLLMFDIGMFLGPTCASGAFQGDFANQANRFLEYLPLRRSAIWLASYVSGLVLLCAMSVSLLWLEVLLFPLAARQKAPRVRGLF